jgi:hypothetical protein
VMPSLRLSSAALRGVFLLAGAGAACTSATLPPIPHAGLVPIRSATVPAAAIVLAPVREAIGIVATRGSQIVIRGQADGPLPGTVYPAVIIDGRLWCPRRGPTGQYTEMAGPVLALQSEAITHVEVLRAAAAARYAQRCAAPVDAVLRIRTRAPRR